VKQIGQGAAIQYSVLAAAATFSTLQHHVTMLVALKIDVHVNRSRVLIEFRPDILRITFTSVLPSLDLSYLHPHYLGTILLLWDHKHVGPYLYK
jgi:hypothetical protein